jgi:hypothetical protein
MSATIIKGPVHQIIDEDIVNGDRSKRAVFLEELKNLPSDEDHTIDYLEILQRHAPQLAQFNPPPHPKFPDTVNLLAYLHDAWYNPSDEPKPRQPLLGLNGFWPREHHPTEPVIRQGLIAAIELATERNLPLDSYWMNTSDRVETIILCNAQQVTRIIMTPPGPPPKVPDILMNFADIRIIKRGEKADWEDIDSLVRMGAVIGTKLKTLSQDEVFRKPAENFPDVSLKNSREAPAFTDHPVLCSELLSCVVHRLRVSSLT